MILCSALNKASHVHAIQSLNILLLRIAGSASPHGLIDEPRMKAAYALYLSKFLTAYENKGTYVRTSYRNFLITLKCHILLKKFSSIVHHY